MNDIYQGREQTQAKHFILETYLKALAMKLLEGGYSRISFVDGFSGPWASKSEKFADTSFKIALTVLSDVAKYFEDKGNPKSINCFFVEKDKAAFLKLQEEVLQYHRPQKRFIVQAMNCPFEDAIPEIQKFVQGSFALIFIDPTGWTGYPLDKMSPLLRQGKGEVLLNFMFDFINRFASSDNEPTIESFERNLGRNWKQKLDPLLPPGLAVERLFCSNLKEAGNYNFVLSTKIEKSQTRRPHFSLIYATRHYEGLKTFRDVENTALSIHEGRVSTARTNTKMIKTGQPSLFDAEDILEHGSFSLAKSTALKHAFSFVEERIKIEKTKLAFQKLAAETMEKFMVRETDVKDLCVDLAKLGKIEPTWKLRGSKIQKPDQDDLLIWIGEDTPPTPPWL